MAIRAKPPQDRTKIEFHVWAYYKLYAQLFLRHVMRKTLEDCHKWLEENKTIPIEVTCDTAKDANMVSYVITKNVTEVKVIESKKFRKK